MIGLLILADKKLGEALLGAVVHTLGSRPPQLAAIELDYGIAPEQMDVLIREAVRKIDQGDGVLILADVYGATHTNVACRLLARGRIELVAGVNLPMLLRVLNYRQLPMEELIHKAISGGSSGILRAGDPAAIREAR
jgi:PTS system mannose-specific IIA component